MQQTLQHPRNDAARAVVGLLLIVVGGAVLGLRQAGMDLNEALGSSGWPFFVIVPGLVLLGMAVVPAAPRGVGFAVAGSIVTTVGGLLLYQARTGDWESWAYAWALIPLAAGVAMVVYGLLARVPGLVTAGSWTGGIAAVVLLIGAWFFAPAFAGADRRLELETWWPAVAIAVGVLMMIRALVSPRAPAPPAGPGTDASRV
jgi:vacuolar-type H+-ATPase subunit I/STV1